MQAYPKKIPNKKNKENPIKVGSIRFPQKDASLPKRAQAYPKKAPQAEK